jgi:hypothetical protein
MGRGYRYVLLPIPARPKKDPAQGGVKSHWRMARLLRIPDRSELAQDVLSPVQQPRVLLGREIVREALSFDPRGLPSDLEGLSTDLRQLLPERLYVRPMHEMSGAAFHTDPDFGPPDRGAISPRRN